MRLSFCLLALVAAATAIPQLGKTPGNVDLLKKQQDTLFLLDQLFQETPNQELRKLGQEYNIKQNIQQYGDQNAVKYLIRLVELGTIQRKRVPFTISFTELRKEVALLIRVFETAKTYDTFLKTAAWARLIFNEAQFYKAFTTAILQRTDTTGLVLPPPYEVFPYYYIDTRVLNEAQNVRVRTLENSQTDAYVIPSNYTAYMTEHDRKLAYFTQDVGLAAWYSLFGTAGWMKAMSQAANLDFTKNYECERCETARGSMFYYVNQQLLARYNLERLSNDIPTLRETEFTHLNVPFKPYLSYPNGLDFPGRSFDYDLMKEKEDLVKTVLTIERRLQDAIDSGFAISTQGSLLALYDRKGLDILGNLIEGTGKSINPRYYGSLRGAARELLGGSPYVKHFWEALPSSLEVSDTSTRDPVFYSMMTRVIHLFMRWQYALPSYKREDLILPGVTIESVKFDNLTTYCDKFMVDIDSATTIPHGKENQHVKIMTAIDRLNHRPFTFDISVNSDKVVKNAVFRIFIGPKYSYDGSYVNIADNESRLKFVEFDQFVHDIKQGQNVITRHSIDAPMRSIDATTKKDLIRKVREGLSSHQLFYPDMIAEAFGFPERLALPKGKRNGMPLQVLVIVSSPNKPTLSYNAVVPPKFQTYQNTEYPDIDITTGIYNEKRVPDYHTSMFSGEDSWNRNTDTDASDRRADATHVATDRQATQNYYERRMDRTADVKSAYMTEYYNNKDITEIIGGAVSLDGRPLGYPLNRRLELGSLHIPNAKIVNVKVFWEGTKCCGSCI